MNSNLFSQKLCPLWDNGDKYGGAREAADGDMAHAQSMLDK